MKKHFFSLFGPQHRKVTISLFAASALMIIATHIIGTTDNLPGIAILLCGVVCLFFAFLHPWENSNYYGILAGVCVGLALLTFLAIFVPFTLHMTEYISEAVIVLIIGFICLPGTIAGIAGTIFWRNRRK